MVPTEILAEQHKESLQNLFPDLPIALLTGGLKAAEKREVLEEISSGKAQLIVGTHALIQEGVHYQDLGLVIIDEQHRFGVSQRRILREKGQNPDVLMMTATPIPGPWLLQPLEIWMCPSLIRCLRDARKSSHVGSSMSS